jgi:glycosyltransferase involved in cell wall biosynthesis
VLTILSVGYPFAAVGPSSVGGAEQIMSLVEAAIARAGHRSVVLAAQGSSCAGSLVELSLPEGLIDSEKRGRALARYRESLDGIVERYGVDVVHMHGVDFASYLPAEGPAVLATLHLPISFYSSDIFTLKRARTFYNCVSASQSADCEVSSVRMCVVPNGIDVRSFPFRATKDGFVVALGRICPEKGFHLALDAARRAGLDMVLAGEVFPYDEHERYFAREIVPRLDDRRRFVGPVAGRAKRELLGRARCLVVPSVVAETSSLVVMEAFACGTPVVARPVGALAHLVRDGETGFLVDGVEELAEAFHRTPRIDPWVCRRVAEERFSAEAMTKSYLELYERVA